MCNYTLTQYTCTHYGVVTVDDKLCAIAKKVNWKPQDCTAKEFEGMKREDRLCDRCKEEGLKPPLGSMESLFEGIGKGKAAQTREEESTGKKKSPSFGAVGHWFNWAVKGWGEEGQPEKRSGEIERLVDAKERHVKREMQRIVREGRSGKSREERGSTSDEGKGEEPERMYVGGELEEDWVCVKSNLECDDSDNEGRVDPWEEKYGIIGLRDNPWGMPRKVLWFGR
ncbi:hypothetical protein K470DRAFT_260118 [Piedraia hortae CBS 480.64]|uniref:Uncharacterized protein n=1 Tax=Piedraia hortae CBS 480.64 TaxID=1314780 RepID=A0A6A7BS48_9PEZI|nr:hypothetical protein K470DRAFT_260118 [Piedraia hortae CBS 480.64]